MKNTRNEKDVILDESASGEPVENIETLEPISQSASMDIKVTGIALQNENNLLARASLLLNDCLAIRGVKIVSGKHGAFVSMPSYQAQGRFIEVCFPTTGEFRQQLNDTVIEAYQQTLAQGQKAMDQARQNAAEGKGAEMESSSPFAGEEQEREMSISM